MGETKPKSPRRPRKSIGSPPPMGPLGGASLDMIEGPTCGHSDCGRMCQVRYVGPTTHMRDHHILHAARGASNVWTAAIVAGLAVVLTGAIAFSAVQAAPIAPTSDTVLSQLQVLNNRMDKLTALVSRMSEQCMPSVAPAAPTLDSIMPGGSVTGGTCELKCKQAEKNNQSSTPFNVEACIKDCGATPPPTTTGDASCLRKCSDTTTACVKTAGDSSEARTRCLTADQTCRSACAVR